MSIRILLNGAKGRMGLAIQACAEDENAVIANCVDMGDELCVKGEQVDAIIDFSFHEITADVAKFAAEHKLPLVIGTTGHTPEEREHVLSLVKDIPVVWSGNYSVGVNLLNYLVAKAAAVLTDGYDPEIIEMHHRHKKDAPSGTAERLLDIVRESRKLSRDQIAHGRSGITGERPADEIGMHALRGGDVVGDHTVLFAGLGERIELTHKASDRRIFAAGSVRAAHWAIGKDAGLYTMQDVLGLND